MNDRLWKDLRKTLEGPESIGQLLREQQKFSDSLTSSVKSVSEAARLVSVSEVARHASESVSEAARHASESVSEAARYASESVSEAARHASKSAYFKSPIISELAGVKIPTALKLADVKMLPTLTEHFRVSEAMGVTAATAARDYFNSFTQTLRENPLVHTFNSSLVNLNDLTRYSDVTEQLLRPLSHLEEQVKAMNVAALGYDAVHLTAFSAIRAVTEQLKFFQSNIGVLDLFPTVPLYQLLTDLAELEPEEFETEEGELKAVVEKIEEFLKTLGENAKKYPSNLVNYFGQATLILFTLSVLLSFHLSSQSASPEDVRDVEHQVEDVKHKVETVQRDLEQQAKAEAERQKRLEEKIDRLTARLEKWSKELSKQQQSLPPAGKSTLYVVTENIEIYSDSSLDSPAIAALSADEPVMVLMESDEWMQIQFFDYLFVELKTGWIQKSYLAPLNSSESEADHTTTPTNNNESPPSFIQSTHGVCGGNARVRNTRIPVWTLVAFRQEGMTEEELLYNYPSLTPKDLEATWVYYQAHQSEIDQAMADQDED